MRNLKIMGICMLYVLISSCSKKDNAFIPKSTLSRAKAVQWSLGDPFVNGVYVLKNPNTQCFEAASTALNAVVRQNTYTGAALQQWDITNLSWGIYKIINHASGLALQVPGSSTAQNVQLTQGTYTGATNQLWIPTYLAWGQYKITNVNSGLAITLDGNSAAQYANITQTTMVVDAAHDWSPTLLASLGTNTTYYVSQSSGNDTNNGLTPATAWKTLAKASAHTYAAGNWLVLKSGDTWTGETLTLQGSGTSLNPILLSSYGTGAKPAIQPAITNEACVKLVGNAGWQISNLDLSKAQDGIRATYDQVYNSDYLLIENCTIHDMDNTYNSSPNLFNHFSNGINIQGYAPTGSGRLLVLSNFILKACTFTNCNQALWAVGTPFNRCNPYVGFTTGDLVKMTNINIQDCTATGCKQWGASLVSCASGIITNFDCTNIGGGANQYGTAAFVASYSQNLVFDGCDINNVYRGPQAIDGDGFDFEGGTAPDGTNEHDITLKNSIINYTEGAGILMFDNGAAHPSTNCHIDNVTISRFGQNPGNVLQGFAPVTGTTGTVSNCTFNRNIPANPFIAGDSSGFTFTNNVYNNIP